MLLENKKSIDSYNLIWQYNLFLLFIVALIVLMVEPIVYLNNWTLYQIIL